MDNKIKKSQNGSICLSVCLCPKQIHFLSKDMPSIISQDPTIKLVYNNDKDLPIFETGKRDRYTAKEAVEILLRVQETKCGKVPLKVRRNMSFLVDVNNFKCWEDIKSDMNGVYFHTLRIATWKLEVEDGKYVDIIEKKKRALTRISLLRRMLRDYAVPYSS